MPALCLYFQLHQPYRVKSYDFTSIGIDHAYFDDKMNQGVLDWMADHCYLPALKVLQSIADESVGKFRVSFSASGTALEQFEQYRPDVLKAFKKLHKTGCVEWVGETYYHSLASAYSWAEFERQVRMQADKIEALFGVRPQIFRNTELLFSNDLVKEVVRLGFKGILVPSTEKLLQQRSPNHVYKTPLSNKLLCLPKNSSLTAEISRNFYSKEHPHYLLPARTFVNWLDELPADAECVNLFMDFGVWCEQPTGETQLRDFFQQFARMAPAHGHAFAWPSELLQMLPSKGKYDVPSAITWSYPDYNLSYLTQNDIQQEAINRLFELEEAVVEKDDPELLADWSRLQASDHFFYMTHKFEEKGEKNMFSPFATAHDAYNYFLNVLTDLEIRVRRG